MCGNPAVTQIPCAHISGPLEFARQVSRRIPWQVHSPHPRGGTRPSLDRSSARVPVVARPACMG